MLGDFNDRRLETATSIRENYTNHMANPNFVPREIRKPGASNTSSDPEHELFMRRKDRVTAALSETAEFFRPMPPLAYNSHRGPKPAWDPSLHSTRGIIVGQEGANAALRERVVPRRVMTAVSSKAARDNHDAFFAGGRESW